MTRTRPPNMRTCLLVALGALATCSNAFYLPGAAPRNYKLGDRVDLFVNALTPQENRDSAKVKSVINYDYYHPVFDFCTPEGGPKKQGESLGSILFGDRIYTSPYEISMLKDNGTCKFLCEKTLLPANAKFMNDRIKEDYALNWIIDGLPAAEIKEDTETGETFFDMGFELGKDDGKFAEKPALHNHYDITLRYHKPSPEEYRIVGVLVWPRTRKTTGKSCGDTNSPPMYLSETQETAVQYTYKITWQESDTPWATRWDNYLHLADPRIHWLSLVNSIAIVVLLCVMVSTILVRSVSRDINRYNTADMEDIQEDYGWKLVHGEVFRAPPAALLLSVLVGNGAQICAMVGVTLVFALLGFLSPSNRGSLATVMMVCWTFFGSVGGYVSARLYASLGGTDKRRNSFVTATALPTVIFAIVFFLNLFLISAGSSGAVPFGTMVVIVLLWFVISAPLSGIGSYFGSKHGGLPNPVRVNQIPRQIPPVPTYLKPGPLTLIAGILPFGAAFMELYYVLSSLFASRAYYAFGFVGLTAGVFALTTAMIAILFTYFLLCAEEYRWHWRAFLAGGGSAVWLILYGLYYWLTRLSLDSASSVMLYFGYLLLLALLDFLVTGTIGFLATYFAVRKLYSSIRID